MTLNDFEWLGTYLVVGKKKCKVTLYDKVGDIVIIQYKKRKSSVVNRCNAMSRYNSYEKYSYKVANCEW